MQRLIKWFVSALIIALLIEIPRSFRPPLLVAQITTPMYHFHWKDYLFNLSDFFSRITSLDPGKDVSGIAPVSDRVLQALLPSMQLLGIGLLLVVLIGALKGIYDGLSAKQSTGLGYLSHGIQWIVEAVPDFCFIIVLEYTSFVLIQHGYPVYFIGSKQFWSGTLVPAALISLIPIMYMSRIVKNTVEEQLGQQYLVTAYAKGLTRKRVIFRHIFPNCLPAVVQTIPVVVAMLLSNLVMVEYLMYRPGIVQTLFYAMGHKGFAPIYTPYMDPPRLFQYYPYDPQLTLFSLAGCVFLFLLSWGFASIIIRVTGYRGQTNPYTSPPPAATWRFGAPWELLVGGTGFVLLLLVGAFANILPLQDPNPLQGDVIHFNGSQISGPPFPPSFEHFLGTDSQGRDLFSRCLHGIVPTFAYVAIPVAVILVVATILAIAACVWEVRIVKHFVSVWNTVFSFIPRALSALLILEIPAVYWFGVHFTPGHVRWGFPHIVVYLGVLCLIETGRVATRFISVISDAMQKTYIEAAIVCGNTRWAIFFNHCRSSFRDALVEQALVETGSVLLLISVLGFFFNPLRSEFLVTFEIPNVMATWGYLSASLDWSGLIAENARDFIVNPWLAAPVLFVTYTILMLNLMSSGFRKMVNSMKPGKLRRGYSPRGGACADQKEVTVSV